MRAWLTEIPSGKQGTRKTLDIMSSVTKKYKTSPAIRLLAQRLVKRVREKNFDEEKKIIYSFVRDKIRYVKDVRGVETIQSPVATLKIGAGDCDDQSILVASLLEAIGHKTRFVACGQIEGVFSHVFTQVLSESGRWESVECTEKWHYGKTPPGIKAKMIKVN